MVYCLFGFVFYLLINVWLVEFVCWVVVVVCYCLYLLLGDCCFFCLVWILVLVVKLEFSLLLLVLVLLTGFVALCIWLCLVVDYTLAF